MANLSATGFQPFNEKISCEPWPSGERDIGRHRESCEIIQPGLKDRAKFIPTLFIKSVAADETTD